MNLKQFSKPPQLKVQKIEDSEEEKTGIDLEQFAEKYHLSPEDKKQVRSFLSDVLEEGKIHSSRFSWLCNKLSPEVLRTQELRSLVESAVIRNITSRDEMGIGVAAEYVKKFDIDPQFFTDERFNNYRKQTWKEYVISGREIDFTSGKIENAYSFGESEEDEHIEELYKGNFNEVRKLFSEQELSEFALSGALKAIDLKNYSSGKEGERLELFHAYQQEFRLSPEKIKEEALQKIRLDILGTTFPEAFLKENPDVENYYSSDEAKELAKNAMNKVVANGQTINQKLFERFKLGPADLDQDQIVKNISGKMDLYNLARCSEYLDDVHYEKIRDVILGLDEESQNTFFEKLLDNVGYSWMEKETQAFSRLKIPPEKLTRCMQKNIVEAIRNNNYSAENFEKEKPRYEQFGFTPDMHQEALNQGYFSALAKSGQFVIEDSNEDYEKRHIGLEKIVFTSETRAIIKQEYLNALRQGEIWKIKNIDAFLDKNKESIGWSPEDREMRKQALLEGIPKVSTHGRKSIEEFIKSYYPDTHHIFFIYDPKVKEAVSQRLAESLSRLNWSGGWNVDVDRQNINEAIQYFALDRSKILEDLEDRFGLIPPGNVPYFEHYLPDFDIKNHNRKWAETKGQEAFHEGLENKNLNFIRDLVSVEEMRPLVLGEIEKQEEVVKDNTLPESAKKYAEDFILEFFWESSFIEGMTLKDQEYVKKLQLHKQGGFIRKIATLDESARHLYCQEHAQNFADNVSSLAENKPLPQLEKFEYELALQEVYPKRNYDTYKNIDKYEDRTKDIEKYSFDRNGVEMRLSGVLGYKIKEGAMVDPEVIKEFSKRINTVKAMATDDGLGNFLSENIQDSKAETLEGKILEYFKQQGYSAETMNVLLAYQLRGQYEDFVSGSEDRLSLEEDRVSKDFVLLDELVNRYGDSMKESIKSVQKAVATSPDSAFFGEPLSGEYVETYKELPHLILSDLSKIPRDKIKDETIQKKILKTVKNTFQNVEDVQKRAAYFSGLFSSNDLDNLPEVWERHMNELFAVKGEYMIDMSKVEALQASIYQRLQNEIGKYEEIKERDSVRGEEKLKKERVIKGYFSKTKESAHARMVGDICLAQDPNMLKNEKYFEFVLFDQERKKCMGTTMLLEMDEGDKKYLLYCPNPSVGLVSEVSAKKLYRHITDQVVKFGQENNFDGILINKTHGRSTNRAGLFQQSLDQSCLKNSEGKEMAINLKNSHVLGGGYNYQEGLQAVWMAPVKS